jgi:phage baseplate assembly protein gpV
MKALLHNTFQVGAGEVIQLATKVDNPPLLAGYTTPPHGSKWAKVKKTNATDTREFTCPGTTGQQVTFAVSCAEAIPTGAPSKVAVYSLSFSSLTNPKDSPVNSGIAVPQGLGPISQTYTFIVQ